MPAAAGAVRSTVAHGPYARHAGGRGTGTGWLPGGSRFRAAAVSGWSHIDHQAQRVWRVTRGRALAKADPALVLRAQDTAKRTALGQDAGLMLELLVPLGLGVSLSTVHRRIDNTVDRLIFRRQYREEIALRRFASESAFVTQLEALLDMTVEQLHRHVGAPWVAYYERTTAGYARVRQCGEHDLPHLVATDDLALVKLRAHNSEVDLHEAPSGLGRDGYAFPLRTRGHLLGALLVGPRPDEHYAAEERELMAHVAHAVGASLFALRAQVTEEQLTAARAEVEASAARLDVACAQARASEALLKDSHARESMLLGALRALGAESRA